MHVDLWEVHCHKCTQDVWDLAFGGGVIVVVGMLLKYKKEAWNYS